MSPKRLTILFTPLDAWGHINCSHGLAEEFISRGHRVVFAIDVAFKGKLEPFGIEEELLTVEDNGDQEFWPQFMEQHSKAMEFTNPAEIMSYFMDIGFSKQLSDVMVHNKLYKKLIVKLNPDLIITDNYICSPAVTNSGLPWVWLYSAAPHGLLQDERIPPMGCGLPLNGDKSDWIKNYDIIKDKAIRVSEKVSRYCISEGAPPLKPPALHPRSPYLNIYLYPQELDYKEVYPLPPNIIRVENFIRHTSETFEIPESLRQRPGKLVFLSMGSFGCANLHLMTRVTTILGKSQHKFIVSKGPLHDKYSLPDNMWGQRFLPQTAILPLVDLVVTHGGNNTVTETFYYGKPMLVLPLFGDQYDNAQRLHETALGLRLNPFYCTERELIDSVDKLLSDVQFTQRMNTIGQRIRNTNDKKVISDLIEHIVHQN